MLVLLIPGLATQVSQRQRDAGAPPAGCQCARDPSLREEERYARDDQQEMNCRFLVAALLGMTSVESRLSPLERIRNGKYMGRAGRPRAEDYFKRAGPSLSPGFGEAGRGMLIHLCASACSSYFYEGVKMVVDVLQRAVLGKAREIRYLPLMA